jgi:predicted metal-dependent phosphoesterase TrpH
VGNLKEAGLAGLEIFYSNYSPTKIARLQQVAAKHGLMSTGGSDYHGLDESIGAELGSVHVPREVVERLISLGGSKGR